MIEVALKLPAATVVTIGPRVHLELTRREFEPLSVNLVEVIDNEIPRHEFREVAITGGWKNPETLVQIKHDVVQEFRPATIR